MQATTVAAQGAASTKFNLVTFSVHLSETAQTVPAAKKRLASAVEDLTTALKDIETELGLKVVRNSVRTSSRVDEDHEWDGKKQVFKGYVMTYSHYFDTPDLDLVNKIYDVLTSLPKVKVQAPVFSLKNRDKLNKRALKQAWGKVEERFAMECETLGLNPADFEVSNWETSYSDSQRSDRVAKSAVAQSARAMGGAPVGAVYSPQMESDSLELPEPTIGFTVGLASVTVNLEVGYVRKSQQTNQ